MTVTAEKLDNRAELIRAAERLLADRGIDGVSLRAVNRAAGQRNASALQYHFGDRDGLVRAIIAKHRAQTDPRRHALLDQYEAEGLAELRPLAAALVLPLAAKLADKDGGREFLQINCEVFTRTVSIAELVPRHDPQSSITRWHRVADSVLAVEEKSELHTRFAAIRFAFVELAHRAIAPPRRDDRLFTSHLTDLVTALLTVGPSDPTKQLMAQRRAAATARDSPSDG